MNFIKADPISIWLFLFLWYDTGTQYNTFFIQNFGRCRAERLLTHNT
jgi:hypothetical protein